MYERKKKTCKSCGKESYIFSKGDCKNCANKRYAEKAQRSKKEPGKKAKNHKRIKPISDKRAKELKEYRKLRDKYMEMHMMCEVEGCNRMANDLHHVSRRGKNLCNVETFMAVCRQCHIKIEDNPIWSKKLGYLK